MGTFDKVQNIGGRASCRMTKPTFFLMRSSQLMAWTPAMQQSYLRDLREAQAQGRNPLSEKYGYMMERTSPAEFARIRHQLPARDPEKDRKIDRILCGACRVAGSAGRTVSKACRPGPPHPPQRGQPVFHLV